MFVNYVPENKTILGWFAQTNQYHPLSVIYLEKSHPQNDGKGQQFIYVILTASWLGGCYILLHPRSDRMTFPYIPSMGNPDCPSVNGATPDYQAEKKQPFFRARIRRSITTSIHPHGYSNENYWLYQVLPRRPRLSAIASDRRVRCDSWWPPPRHCSARATRPGSAGGRDGSSSTVVVA
jgi:hypothetical protein